MKNKRALWLTSDAENTRLVSIVQEHVRLAREVSDQRKAGASIKAVSALIDRIEELRRERNAILYKYEGNDAG